MWRIPVLFLIQAEISSKDGALWPHGIALKYFAKRDWYKKTKKTQKVSYRYFMPVQDKQCNVVSLICTQEGCTLCWPGRIVRVVRAPRLPLPKFVVFLSNRNAPSAWQKYRRKQAQRKKYRSEVLLKSDLSSYPANEGKQEKRNSHNQNINTRTRMAPLLIVLRIPSHGSTKLPTVCWYTRC